MAPWLFGFVAGVLLGRADASFLTPRLLGGASLLTVGFAVLVLLRFRKIALFAVGLAWGFANAAPTFEGEIDSVDVVRSDSFFAAPRPVLLIADGQVFQAVAPPGFAAAGALRFKALGSGLGAGRSTLRASVEPNSDERLLARVVEAMRAWFHGRLANDRPFMRNWLVGIILGERTALPQRVTAAFKSTGTYHLLAVSGLHVSLLVVALSLALRAPFQAAYALRLLRPGAWRHWSSGLNVLAAAIAVVYLAVAGMPAAAQRSVLTYAVIQLGAVSCGIPSLKRRLLLAAVLQTLFFPIGFVSEGSFMSWAAYLLVLRGLRARVFTTQLQLTVMAAAAFGQLPLLGILANLVLVPVFSLLLILGLVAVVVGPWLPGRELILALHASFIEIVMFLARLIDDWPWLSLSGDRLPAFCRAGFWLLSSIFLLNTCRDLSIDQNDGEDARCLRSPGSEKAW